MNFLKQIWHDHVREKGDINSFGYGMEIWYSKLKNDRKKNFFF